MIEQKLRQAADAMPEPKTAWDFVYIESAERRPQKRYRLIAAVAAVVLLVGCGATAVTYGNYSGFSWASLVSLFVGIPLEMLEPGYEEAQKEAEKLGITIPEQFGNSPVCQFETINTSTQGNWILSWFDHDYQRFWVSYGIENEIVEQAPDNPDGTPGRRKTTHFETQRLSLIFGSTEGELWRELFRFDENEVWHTEGLLPETYRTMEYRGQTMQMGVFGYTYDYHDYEMVWDEELQSYELKLISVEPRTDYTFCVTWVDEASGVVFLMYTDTREEYADDLTTGVGEETLVEYAKQLIDMNS